MSNSTIEEPLKKEMSFVLGSVSILNAFTNILLIVSVSLTPSLKGITGWLMVSEQMSSFLFQLSFTCAVIIGHPSRISAIVIPSFGTSFYLASTAFLTFQNFNMYLSVCRPTSNVYKTFTRSRCTMGIILTTWIAIAVVGFAAMHNIFYDKIRVEGMRVVMFNNKAIWLPVLIYLFGVILPLASDVFCFWQVHKTSSEIAPVTSFRQAQQRLQSLKLAKFIIVNTIAISVSFFAFAIVHSISMFMVPTASVKLALFISLTFFLIYVSFRPVIYYTCYKPLWRTAKQAFCRRTRQRLNTTNIAVLPR